MVPINQGPIFRRNCLVKSPWKYWNSKLLVYTVLHLMRIQIFIVTIRRFCRGTRLSRSTLGFTLMKRTGNVQIYWGDVVNIGRVFWFSFQYHHHEVRKRSETNRSNPGIFVYRGSAHSLQTLWFNKMQGLSSNNQILINAKSEPTS